MSPKDSRGVRRTQTLIFELRSEAQQGCVGGVGGCRSDGLVPPCTAGAALVWRGGAVGLGAASWRLGAVTWDMLGSPWGGIKQTWACDGDAGEGTSMCRGPSHNSLQHLGTFSSFTPGSRGSSCWVLSRAGWGSGRSERGRGRELRGVRALWNQPTAEGAKEHT